MIIITILKKMLRLLLMMIGLLVRILGHQYSRDPKFKTTKWLHGHLCLLWSIKWVPRTFVEWQIKSNSAQCSGFAAFRQVNPINKKATWGIQWLPYSQPRKLSGVHATTEYCLSESQCRTQIAGAKNMQCYQLRREIY